MNWPRRLYVGMITALAIGILAMIQLAHSQRLGPHDHSAVLMVPLGEVDHDLLTAIGGEIATVYGLPPRISRRAVTLPAYALNQERGQYLAGALRVELADRAKTKHLCVVGVTEADLYAPGLNFVFGEADLPGNTAIISLAHLRPTTSSESITAAHLRERAAKVAVHEVGHLLGLNHCPDESCVMAFVNSAATLDVTSSRLCSSCLRQLQ